MYTAPTFLPSLTMFDTLTRLGLSSMTPHIHKTLPLTSLSMFLWPDLASLHQHDTSTKPCPSLHYQCFSDQTWPLFTNTSTKPCPSFHYQCLTLCPNLASLHQHYTSTKPCPSLPPFIINVWHFVQTRPLFTNTTHWQNFALTRLGLSSPTLHIDKT